MTQMGPYSLIFSNDITDDPVKAIELSEEVAPYFDAIKIGMSTAALRRDFGLLGDVKQATGKIIVADFKVADIGFRNKSGVWEGTNEKIVRRAVNAGADYVICHTFPGISSLQECIDVGHSLGAKILTLPFMTGSGAELFFGQPIDKEHSNEVLNKLGIDVNIGSCRTISDLILVLGESVGVDGYIGPANLPLVLMRYREITKKPIFSPGIGRQAFDGATPQQQMRTFFDICGHNSCPIIGSAVYGAANPREAAADFKRWRNEIAGD